MRNLQKSALLCAAYIVLITLNPLGFGPVQFRIGEALAVIPFFNRKYAVAFTLAAAIANLYSPLGPLDMVVGGACCALSYCLSMRVRNNYINAVIYSAIAGILVGAELAYVAGAPFVFSAASVFISSALITLIGVRVFSKNKTLNALIRA